MERREFNRLCGGLMAGAASLHLSAHANASPSQVPYPESQLVYDDDSPVTLQSLESGVAYIFGYPYVTTPCFLVRLKRSSPARGGWPGGLDTDQSVVAFSAICSHKMSHPAKPISHIAYRDEQGNIRATGSFGENQYERFLTKFGFRLSMEYGVTDIRARSGKFCKSIRSDAFSAQQVLC